MYATLLQTFVVISICTLGSTQSPKLLKDINSRPYPSSSRPDPGNYPNGRARSFSRLGTVILLSAETEASGREPWISNGTRAGTLMLKDIHAGTGASYPGSFVVTRDGKRAFFVADDGQAGMELWVTDGTTAGTKLVKDLNTGAASSWPVQLVAFGASSALFVALPGTNGPVIYVSDGSATGTQLVKNVQPGSTTTSAYDL
jgi:ELWxxDGT repeat protein